MAKFASLLSTALVVLSLASCSKESYTFRNTAPYGTTYTAATPVTTPAAEATEVAAPAAEAAPAANLTASTAAVTAPTKQVRRSHTAPVAAKAEVAAETKAAPTKAEIKEAKATLKALRKEAKKNAASPLADGKSQLTALILLLVVGGFGVHRFYLGYTGRGILYIALLLTSFLIVPAIALLVLLIMDLINILNGKLQPKGGSYAKTL